jgi:hypothetical protein
MRAEDERGLHSGFLPQSLGDLSAQAHRLREDIAHDAVEGMRCVRRPQAEIADASAADITLLRETLEREVHRPFCAADASNQVARVELLAGGAAQERQELNLGRALPKPRRASQCPHVLDTNTIVLVSETRLCELFLAAREHGRGERERGHRADQ